jgi:hypothetical protein
MDELKKMENWLAENAAKYEWTFERQDIKSPFSGFVPGLGILDNDRHQILVFDKSHNVIWDAICHNGSYGYEQGLLEISGTLVNEEEDGDTVAGFLTSEDIVERIVRQYKPVTV